MKYIEEEKQAIKECESLIKQEYYGDMYFYERRSIQIVLNLLEKQKKQIERLEKTIDENIVIEPDETGCHEELNIHIKDYIPKEAIREKIEEIKKEKEQLGEKNVTWDSGIYKIELKINILKELLGE